MDWAQFVAQWLHVLLGIVWFGAVLYNALILFPAMNPLPIGQQRTFGAAIGARAFKVITPIAWAVIALGIIRGTILGPIKGLDDLGTTYGITWLVALAFAIGAYFWAERVIRPALDAANAIPESEAVGPDGHPNPRFATALADVKRKAVLELGFFVVIFTCMILMRFGL